MKDNYDLWEDHDAKQEEWLKRLPVCDCCGEPIQDEHCFVIEDEIYCEGCMIELFRKDTDDYVR